MSKFTIGQPLTVQSLNEAEKSISASTYTDATQLIIGVTETTPYDEYSNALRIQKAIGGSHPTTIVAPNVYVDTVINLPTHTGVGTMTLVAKDTEDTLTNKTLTTPTLTQPIIYEPVIKNSSENRWNLPTTTSNVTLVTEQLQQTLTNKLLSSGVTFDDAFAKYIMGTGLEDASIVVLNPDNNQYFITIQPTVPTIYYLKNGNYEIQSTSTIDFADGNITAIISEGESTITNSKPSLILKTQYCKNIHFFLYTSSSATTAQFEIERFDNLFFESIEAQNRPILKTTMFGNGLRVAGEVNYVHGFGLECRNISNIWYNGKENTLFTDSINISSIYYNDYSSASSPKDIFVGCYDVDKLYIQSFNNHMANVFNGCKNIKNSTFIGTFPSLYSNCVNIEGVEISSEDPIISNLFSDCTNVTNIEFKNIPYTNDYIFNNCINISKIRFGGNVTRAIRDSSNISDIVRIEDTKDHALENSTGASFITDCYSVSNVLALGIYSTKMEKVINTSRMVSDCYIEVTSTNASSRYGIYGSHKVTNNHVVMGYSTKYPSMAFASCYATAEISTGFECADTANGGFNSSPV